MMYSRPVIVKQYLGTVLRHEIKDRCFYFYDERSCVEVKVCSDYIIRVRLAPQGTFLPEFSYAVTSSDFHTGTLRFHETDEHYQVSTSAVSCLINKQNFRIFFVDQEGLVMNEDAVSAHWEENAEFGGYQVFSTKQSQKEENFYGLGDKATDFNLLGRRFTLWSSDMYAFEKEKDPLYKNIPFYIGLHHQKCYGLFYDNTFRTHFDFCSQQTRGVSYRAEGGELQYYYIHGPAMSDVVRDFARLTGTHPMPPLWALGYHQCRWSYYPENKVREIARTFRKKQIPCDAIYLDIDYMDGFRCFTWNQEYFPDPRQLMSDLLSYGFKTVVIVDPGIKVDENYFVFKEGAEKKYFCRRSDDYFMEGPVWPGKCQFPDFTHPKVRRWWGSLFREFVDQGVAGFWNDMNEPSVLGAGTFPNDVRHNYDGHRGSHRKAHNVYGMQMVRATYEGLQKLQKNKRPFAITRAAYAGTQRYAATWTGDNIATWEHLKLASIMCQRLSISGMPFAGSDIGGFTGESDGELFTRWMQLGVFSPLMRAHSAGDTTEREPWSFGEPYESICRKFIELRYKLLPYIYSVFWEHHRYGYPMLRPLLMWEQLAAHANRQDEFSFGEKIMVCPILEPNAKGRTMYLPKGRWYNYWTHKPAEGGQELWVDAPLDSMPIFVQAGAIIPEWPVMQYTGQISPKEITLNVYYAATGDDYVNSFLYEDHGDNLGYEQNIYLEKKFMLQGGADRLSIRQSFKGIFTPRYDNYLVRVIGVPFEMSMINIDDTIVSIYDFMLDRESNTLTFRTSKSFERIIIS